MGSGSDREYAWWVFTTSVIGWEVCQWGGLEYSQPLWLIERRVNGVVYDYSIIPGYNAILFSISADVPLINTTYNGMNGEVGIFWRRAVWDGTCMVQLDALVVSATLISTHNNSRQEAQTTLDFF